LLEASGNNKAARAGFISYFQMSIGMSFEDAAEGFFEAVDIVGDRAEEADFAFGTRFSDGDGDGVFVDIKAQVECNSIHGVVVRLYFIAMNQNAYPAVSEDVLAALPTRATRDIMNGSHTTFFNPRAADAVRAVSHKV
jgi:hypothetical protein